MNGSAPPNFYDNDPILSHQGKAVQTTGESSIVAVDAALDWIGKSVKNETPFLAVVWFGSPHSPHRAAEQDRALYDDQPTNVQQFLGEITGMDRAFGKLRDGLGELGIRDNTVLWYCSDNGALPKVGSTGGHRGNKGTIYEGGLLVPAILEWPAKIRAHRSTETRCNTCDIYPTLLEITGARVNHPVPLDGVSLLPLIEGKQLNRDRAMGFWDYTSIKGIGTPSDVWMGELLSAQRAGGDLPPHESSQHAAQLPDPPYSTSKFPGHAAWIDGDWKLHRIENNSGKIVWELYDLNSDDAETTNVLRENAAVAERLKPALQDWLGSVARSLNGEDYLAENHTSDPK